MKKLSASVIAVSILAMSAGSALANTYQGTVVRTGDGAWTVGWIGVTPLCDPFDFFNTSQLPTTATVDGVEVPLETPFATVDPQGYSIKYRPSPDGNLTSIKIDGKTSFQCEMHTFLLPGYVAPPAPVPTLSEWAMILLGVVLAGGAATFIQRRRHAASNSPA